MTHTRAGGVTHAQQGATPPPRNHSRTQNPMSRRARRCRSCAPEGQTPSLRDRNPKGGGACPARADLNPLRGELARPASSPRLERSPVQRARIICHQRQAATKAGTVEPEVGRW
jgi:hypothetical protein